MKLKPVLLLPQLFFLALLCIVLFVPNSVENKNPLPFVIFILALNAAVSPVILIRKNPAAADTFVIVYALLIVWELFTAKLPQKPNMLYPTPERIFNIFIQDSKLILKGIGSSIELLALGYAGGLLLGVSSGAAVGSSKKASSIFLPIARIITPIPPLIYTPYAVFLLKTFHQVSVFIVFCGVFWFMFLRIAGTVSGMDERLKQSIKVLNVNRADYFFNILIPYCLPGILSGISLSLSGSFMILISAEMLGGKSGVGWYPKFNANYGNYDKVVAGIIVVALLVTVINIALKYLRKKLIRWEM